jgi:hypothetical protein
MTAPSTTRMRTELAGAQARSCRCSTASTAEAAARAMTSAASARASDSTVPGSVTPASTRASLGAADQKGTKPLLIGPRKDDVRNMK